MTRKRIISSVFVIVYLGLFFFRHKMKIDSPFFSTLGAIGVIVVYFLINSFRIRITRD